MLPKGKVFWAIALFIWGGCEGRAALRVPRHDGRTTDAGIKAMSSQCPEGTQPRVVPMDTQVKLDLLFMIDDSLSMQEEQANLARNFPRLIEELRKMPAGLPDLHLGVVSSNMGAGEASFGGSCGTSLGDRAVFQVRNGCGLEKGRFLISRDNGSNNNFEGNIADVFACLAEIGTGGCGFEHQLQSVRMALSGFVSDNSGFLRGDAHLAVVYITDEDDCSAPADSSLFGTSVSGQDSSLRCSLAGHLCNGKAPPADAFSTPLENCSAAPDGGGKLIPVKTFIDEMKQLRTQSVSISVIGGWPLDVENAKYTIDYDQSSSNSVYLTSMPICSSSNGKAVVGLRLKQFVDAFGAAGKFISICQDDFSTAMTQVGELINTNVECQ
jgi:hypothetical protein